MSDQDRGLTRRDFLRGTATAALAAAFGVPAAVSRASGPARLADAAGAAAPVAEKRARVVLIRNAAAVADDGALNADVVSHMIDEAVAKLLGVNSADAAWAQLLKPADIVGIKSNVWAPLRTPVAVEEALRRRFLAAGVSADNVRVTDRDARRLLADCTALVNCRPARAHHWAGIGGCIKNYIMFSDNPAQYHPNACENLADVWNLPGCKGKTRLNILLLLTPQFVCRGPHNFDPKYIWPYRGLVASLDPVAVDAVGAHLLHLKRMAVFGEEQPGTPTSHIGFAETKFGLGVADLNRIDLVKLGWADDILL
jgi:hypothetical protein